MASSAPHRSPISGTAAHLARELALLELRLKREVQLARAEQSAGGRRDEFAGLYIPDEEIDRYLDEDGGEAGPTGRPAPVAALDARIDASRRGLGKDLRDAERRGVSSRLVHLREAFSLGDAEYGMVVACLAADLDLRYERYFAYLQNDVSRRRPCVQLLGRLFLDQANDYAALRRIFASASSLVGARLLEMGKSGPEVGFAAREPRVAEGVAHFLLEVDGSDPDWKGMGRWRSGKPLPDEPGYFRRHHEMLGTILDHARRGDRIPCTLLWGPGGCAKEDLVLALAEGLSARVVEWDAEELLTFSGDWAERLHVMERDLRLYEAFLWLRHADALVGADAAVRSRLKAMASFVGDHGGVNLVVTAERKPAELRSVLGAAGLPILELVIEPPDLGERAELWRALIEPEAPKDAPAASQALWDSLAAKFRFGPGRILSAVRGMGGDEPQPGAPGWEGALHQACRLESSAGLGGFARKMPIKYRWSDLVLPGEVTEQLHEIRNCVRQRRRVYGEWGFGEKFSLGKGLNLLFSGASGTGKTMAAEVLAQDLGLDLYQIDLSSVVSKYIGETEKNLSRIFGDAQSANSILLFDEADALFGRRSEVKDSHDRYANIEINYLLQRMEEYEGIVVLTTNMLKNLDPAFTRRIHYTVEFPLPDESQRQDLWSKVFPASMPRSADVDLGFLAKRFKLTGANIKNVALNGAFLAAANGGVVDMAHLILALKREYRKLGRLASKGEFGPYYSLVREGGPSDDPAPPLEPR